MHKFLFHRALLDDGKDGESCPMGNAAASPLAHSEEGRGVWPGISPRTPSHRFSIRQALSRCVSSAQATVIRIPTCLVCPSESRQWYVKNRLCTGDPGSKKKKKKEEEKKRKKKRCPSSKANTLISTVGAHIPRSLHQAASPALTVPTASAHRRHGMGVAV